MDFGKLHSVDHVRFDLPPEDPKTTTYLNGKARSSSLRIFIGGPVWTCPSWIGKVYPKGIAARDYLRAYGQQFNSIELNSSFYRIPDRKQVETWKTMVPSDFKFAPKLHQNISHFKSFGEAKKDLKIFWENIQHFEENLGLCFLQLPPHFDIQSGLVLKQLLQEIPDRSKLAIEFRHPSWFAHGTLHPKVTDFLQTQGVSTVITDVAGRRDVLHASLTTRKVLIRFTGNELHPTDYTRLDSWVNRITSWIERGIEEVYFFIHQPTEAEVPELSQYFIQSINARCGLSLRSWCAVQEIPSLKSSQMSLF